MPILETGTSRTCERGFTLVEVMVTLLLLGLVTGVALLTLPSGGADLPREAEQLGQRIRQAQREAILTNRAVEIIVAGTESRLRMRRAGRWEDITEGPFRPRVWPDGVNAAMAQGHGVRFDPSGAAEPAVIRLSAGKRALDLRVDAQGQVAIYEP